MASMAPNPLPPDEFIGAKIVVIAWIEAVVAISFVVARMYTRARLVRNVGADDWIMVFTLILSLICSCFVTLEVHYGVGRHIYYLTPGNIEQTGKMVWMTEPFSTMSACFGKISIAFQLLRIINKQNRWQAHILWFMIGSLFLVNVVCLIITFAQCTPVYALWDRTVGTCWSPLIQLDSGYVQGAYSAFTDLFLTLFPIVVIWNLQVKLKVKVALAALFAMGLVATVAAAIKTAHLGELSDPDFTWVTVDLIIWYTTENYIIIIGGCLPTLRPLFNLSFGSAAASKESKKRWKGYSSGSGGSASKSAASHPYRASDEAYVLSRVAENPYHGENNTQTNYEAKPALYSPADEVNGIKRTTEISIV
ncbi:hypothetical protein MMC27_002748 [Xylographa pallens]|nr:hypothetical protein [Xylographa pallens]